MLSSLYVNSDGEQSNDYDDDERGVVNVLSQTEIQQLKAEVGNVKEQFQGSETKHCLVEQCKDCEIEGWGRS